MKRFYHLLYFWVLLAIAAGACTGYYFPATGSALKPVSDAFIALIRMLIAPIVFCTIVLGIASAGDMKKVGRIGFRTLLYFEALSTLALAIGVAAGNILKPGAGFHANAAKLDGAGVKDYVEKASSLTFSEHLLRLIPKTFVDAFTAQGDLLQVLLVAILFGYALNAAGARARAVQGLVEELSRLFFSMVNAVMKLAPLGAGAAMAYTVGQYGLEALAPMAKLMGVFYLTCAVFVGGVLGLVAHLTGFSLWRFLKYLREEILILIGTSSSESVLAPLMEKLEKMGCSRGVTGLVVPSGYSFNLDGTNIYITLATLFVAQALDIDLTPLQQMEIFAVAMLTSKGAAGVTGAGFITLAATLAVVPDVPVKGLVLILGVDRFMSEARAVTNFIGNGVAAIVLSAWEGELDRKALAKALGDD